MPGPVESPEESPEVEMADIKDDEEMVGIEHHEEVSKSPQPDGNEKDRSEFSKNSQSNEIDEDRSDISKEPQSDGIDEHHSELSTNPPLNGNDEDDSEISKNLNSDSDQEYHSINGHLSSTEITPETTATQETKTEVIQSVERDESNSPRPLQPGLATSSDDAKQAPIPLPMTLDESIRREKDLARLSEVLKDTHHKAWQQVLRENWRLFLFHGYDQEHISFVIRAGLKNANTPVLEKVLRDDSIFKDPLMNVTAQKPEFWTHPDLVANVLKNAKVFQILAHVPEWVLDEVVAQRIKNVERIKLARWLAEGERLGFSKDDLHVLNGQVEAVIPSLPQGVARGLPASNDLLSKDSAVRTPTTNGHPYEGLALSHTDPLLAEQERNLVVKEREDEERSIALENQKKRVALENQKQKSMVQADAKQKVAVKAAAIRDRENQAGAEEIHQESLICPDCNQTLPTFSGYTYHVHKKPCQKQPPNGLVVWKYFCTNCCSGFTQSVGLTYHKNRKVCQSSEIASPTSPSQQLQQEANAGEDKYPRPIAPPRPDAIVSVQRPSMHTQVSPSYPVVHIPPSPAKATVRKPPLSTPSYSTPAGKIQQPEIRHSPSELPPQRLAALEADLQKVTDAYNKGMAEIPDSWTQMEKDARIFSLKNQWSTKKSQIRKKYGVSLRMREKDKEARRAAGIDVQPLPKRYDDFRPHQTSSSPASSFSPINTPPARSSMNGYRAPTPPNGHHPSQTNSHPRQSSEFHGFGILQPGNAPKPHQSAYSQPDPHKRRRSEDEGRQGRSYHPYYSPQPQRSSLSMVETSSQDAAAKFAKKPSKISTSGKAGLPVSAPSSAGLPDRSGSKKTIIIDLADSDSSDSDSDIPAIATSKLPENKMPPKQSEKTGDSTEDERAKEGERGSETTEEDS